MANPHRLSYETKDKNMSSMIKIRKDSDNVHNFSSFGKKKERNSLYNTNETFVSNSTLSG